MINDKKVLGIIPARGGSKGVPGKNIRMLGDKPLIAWTIEEAAKSIYLDRTIVSSDDEAIIQTALKYGGDVPFKRPDHLAQDDTPGMAPILHAIEHLPEYEYIVLLQPTSPLRTYEDIDRCIECFVNDGAASAVTVTEQEKSPYWMFQLNEGKILEPVMGETKPLTRQELPKIYVLNGAVYVSSAAHLKKFESFVAGETSGCIMPKERSIDIDTVMDFKICEVLLHENSLPQSFS
ncbi:acylneuraminate cytidylyltransferase family protein [Paenibacillus radicis (ex Gao et al. 2016)]|uniref:Acylneuraminate cytidylyltransferase family protein n=1 Tax=Paenibacillus radicis (ex Gao et al. 2016) TaxID=1737354 RepID=A0A917HMN7_9BACL|nr:acylneuraminate cytidylyltransferase family protein [Paenibacillus radicis (ex Gao et al. 2016)]GGG84552.1 hypothetical protein GCM10010918_48000 [Paenibacillus radicis (ex Gao et al. 2016)]